MPPHLIEAFKSTLSELSEADLLLHVVDISDDNWPHHIQTVHEILNDLGIDQEIFYVFNKTDRLTPEEQEDLAFKLERYQPHVLISAQSKAGIEPLLKALNRWHRQQKTA